MRRSVLASCLALIAGIAQGHPSRSIVVVANNSVIVPDAVRSVIWRIDEEGVRALARGVHTHWAVPSGSGGVLVEHLSYDAGSGTFAQSLVRIEADGAKRVLVEASEGPAPFGSFLALEDGSVLRSPESGSPRILIRGADGHEDVYAQPSADAPFQAVTAMAKGPGGAVFFTDGVGVFSVSGERVVRRILEKLPRGEAAAAGAEIPIDIGVAWGMGADDAGSTFVAEPGARRVWQVTADAPPRIVQRSKAPWFPTGVAWHEGSLYVVEHALEDEKNSGPRVVVVDDDDQRVLGTVTE